MALDFSRNIPVLDAKREYDLFVKAYEDPNFVYGTGKGWKFPGDPGTIKWVGPEAVIKNGCSFGASQVIPRITVNSDESCADPSRLVQNIIDTVVSYIPDKDKRNYGQLIMAFKRIGKLKLNRLRDNPRFVSLCDEIHNVKASINSGNLSKKEKKEAADMKKNLDKQLSTLVLNTLSEILNNVPACKERKDFVKFVFTEAELALNGNNQNGRQVEEAASAGRSGAAAASSAAASVGNIGSGPRAENKPEAVVAVVNNAAGNGAGAAAAANGVVLGVNGAGAAAAANAPARRTRRRPALTPAAAAELAAMARRQAAANASAENELTPSQAIMRRWTALGQQRIESRKRAAAGKVVDSVINRVKTNTLEGLRGKLRTLEDAIEKAETSGVPTNREWLSHIGLPLRNRYISEIAKKNGVNVNNSENSNNSARPSSFKGLRLRRNNQSTRRKNRKASRKNKNTRRH